MDQLLLLAEGEGVVVAGGLFLVWVALIIASIAVWIWALVDAIKNPRLDDTSRIVWVIVIVATQIIGAIIYLAVGRSGSTSSASPT